MKKYLPLIVVGILIASGLGAVAGIESEKEKFTFDIVEFSQLLIEEQEDYIRIDLPEATSKTWEQDKPALPALTKVYTYPLGTKIIDVDVSLSNFKEVKLTKPVEPSAEVQIASMYVSNEITEPEKVLTYSDIDVFPDCQYDYKTAAGLKDGENVLYLTVTIYPVQYYPKQEILYYSEKASIDISYNPPANPVVFPDEYDLLIITPTTFESTLQRLVDHKNNLDPPIRTKLTTLDEIPSVGVDEQESIKYYIKDAKENWGISYVLLVGAGVNGSELFPVRKAWIDSKPHEDYFPTELYYADFYNSTMEFADWDYDEDGKFAEYGPFEKDKYDMDLLPDVYLGKIPCNDNAELDIVIDKIIYYKEHNKMTKKIILIGADSHAGDPIPEGEYANDKVLDKLPGYTPTRLWDSNDQLTKANIGAGFRANPDFVDISGHGSPWSWASHPFGDNDVWIPEATLLSRWTGFRVPDFDTYRFNNPKKFPVVTFTACSNNKYTMTKDCIGWKFVCREGGGSIATFAEAGIGIFQTNTGITERLIGWMEVKVHEEMYNTKMLGQVWANCISGYYSNFEKLNKNDYKTMVEWTMFGDPTTSIEDGDDPRVRSIDESNFLFRLFDRIPFIQQFLQRLKLI
jgi:hypothetical protein